MSVRAPPWQVCNTFRRAVTIVAAAIVFQNAISPASASGIALIIGGAAAYAVASARAKAKATAAPEDDALLQDSSKTAHESGGESSGSTAV